MEGAFHTLAADGRWDDLIYKDDDEKISSQARYEDSTEKD